MTPFLIIVLCLLSAAFVLLPLRTRAQSADFEYSNGREQNNRKRLMEKQKGLARQIKDIEFDYSMGKINADDYDQWRGDLDAQLTTVKNQLQSEATKHTANPVFATDFDVEAEVLIARARRKRALQNAVSGATWTCSCGRTMSENDRFCASCGAAHV